MYCPNCTSNISLLDIAMAEHDDTGGVQIRFECDKCRHEYFAILTPRTFVEVP